MSDKLPLGSRDDLCRDRSRCLRVRFNESSCNRCAAVCPSNALSLEEGLVIDSGLCSGCLLCSSVCPTGALEISTDFLACVSQLSKVPEPVLVCCRTREQANGWLACLGGLSDEHLLHLSRRLNGVLTLNISRCKECPNSSMLPLVRTRLENLAPGGSCHIVAVETAGAVRHREETVDRRSFFKSFRTSLFQTAAAVMSAGSQETERSTEYIAKRLPNRRTLLNMVLEQMDPSVKQEMEERFFGRITFSEACTACQACAAICPTGALKKNPEDSEASPLFDPAACTTCGLCVEFCWYRALLPVNFTAKQREPEEVDCTQEYDDTYYAGEE